MSAARALATALGHVTIVRKGQQDLITDGIDGPTLPRAMVFR